MKKFHFSFPFLAVLVLYGMILLPACSQSGDETAVLNLSAPAETDTIPSGWRTEYWSDQRFYSFSPSDRSAYMSLIIDADTLAYARWVMNLPLQPYSKYRITAWIKTENVVPARDGGGAGFRLGKLESTGEVLQLYRRELGTIPIELTGNMAPLDMAASLTDDGKYLTLSVINPATEEQKLALGMESAKLPASGLMLYITGSDRYVLNDVDKPDVVERQSPFSMSRGSVSIPAMSACILKFEWQH